MLNEKQLEVIQRLVAGEQGIMEILKDMNIATSTYYYWRNNNKAFNDAYDSAIEAKVDEARKNIRIDIRKYIKRLDELSESGANENARVNAIAKILTLGNLDPANKQELIVKADDEEQKNYMKELLDELEEDKEQ